MWAEAPLVYWYLAALRIILVLTPQPGYIHPDEFFQSVEVLAGKVFELESNPPWEFNVTFPIRSMTIPYFTTGFIYQATRMLHRLLIQYAGTALFATSTYLIVAAPRIFMCIASFSADFSFYKICATNNEKYKTKLVVLASSYVIMVYSTRTFSNSIELILFALLLYFVAESLIFSNVLVKKREYLDHRYKSSQSTVEKVKFFKFKQYLVSDSLRNCWQISVITVFGFFNRPTFLAFAVIPVFFWLYRGIGSKVTKPLHFHLRILFLVLFSIPSVLFNVLVDSFFYGYLTWGEVGVLDVSINNFVFTPLNFIKYNFDSTNLAKHGLHPRFLHSFVNMPLLFGVLAVPAAWALLNALYNITQGRHQLLPTVRSIKGLMMLSYLTPLALLSLFPHQEPRFLIPLILPLVYLYSSTIYPEPDTVLIKLETKRTPPTTNQSQAPTSALFKLWLLSNVILTLFYGFIHQGGVYSAANYLSKDLTINRNTQYHIITSHIYSIPETFLVEKSSDRLYFAVNTKYKRNKRVFLYEEGSADVGVLLRRVEEIFYRAKVKAGKVKFKVVLIVAGSLSEKLLGYKTPLELSEIGIFYPHVSTEAFPDLSNELVYFYTNFNFSDFKTLIPLYLYRLRECFGLKLLEVTL